MLCSIAQSRGTIYSQRCDLFCPHLLNFTSIHSIRQAEISIYFSYCSFVKLSQSIESYHFIHLHSHLIFYDSTNISSSSDKDQQEAGYDRCANQHALTKIVIQQKFSHHLCLLDFCHSTELNFIDWQKQSTYGHTLRQLFLH